MKLHQLIETTTVGAIAPVSAPLGSTQKRAGSLFKGKKTKKPFVEGAVEETRRMTPGEKLSRAFDRERAKSQRILDVAKRERDAIMARWAKEKEEHEKKNAPAQPVAENDADDLEHTADVQAAFNQQLKKNNAVPIDETIDPKWKNERPKGCRCPTSSRKNSKCPIHGDYHGLDETAIAEADIKENDVVLAPGKGSKFRSDIISKKKTGPLAKFKPPFKATGLWISDSRGVRVSECESAEIAAEVAKMLNTPVDEGTVLMKGASPEARQRDIDQSDREYIVQKQAKARYKYWTEDEVEPEENSKMWHYILDNKTGEKHEPDWSPYSRMSTWDIIMYMNLVHNGGAPTREEAHTNGPLTSEDLMKISKARGLKEDIVDEASNDYYKPRYDFTGSARDVPPSLGVFDRKKTISVDGASYGYVPKMGRIWIYQSGECIGWVEPTKNPVRPNDLRELIRNYLKTIPKGYPGSQIEEEIIMDWDKFPNKVTAKGWENLKALTQAADSHSGADIELGGDLVTLDNKEVHLVLKLYREAVYAKRHEEMLRVLASPHKFHKMIQKLANAGQVNFTDVVEASKGGENWKPNPEWGFLAHNTKNEADFFKQLNSELAYYIKKKFGGRAWFNGGAYSYLIDISKPRAIFASDGPANPIIVKGWAQGLKDYASKWAWDEFISAEPESGYWDRMFRPAKSIKGQGDHEYAAHMGYTPSDGPVFEGMSSTQHKWAKRFAAEKTIKADIDKLFKSGKKPQEVYDRVTAAHTYESSRFIKQLVLNAYSKLQGKTFESKWYDNPAITAKYKKIMEAAEASQEWSWKKLGTKPFSGKDRSVVFTGTATLYKFEGDAVIVDGKRKMKAPRAGVVYQFKITDGGTAYGPSALIAGNSGAIGDAIIKAFGLQGHKLRWAPAGQAFFNWGTPIGQTGSGDGEEQDWSNGKGSLVFL